MALAIAFVPILIIGVIYLSVAWGLWCDMPKKSELENISNPVASVVYAREGQELGRYYVQNRAFLAKDSINPFFLNALISIEDHRFYKHHGIDYKSLMRVFFKTLLMQREASGGGSTITQQLVKNLYPRIRFKLFGLPMNKFREMHIARDLERIYSKEEILWLYSSTVPFGEQVFGLETASERFFNKSQKDLNIEEAATLAGILKATSYYSPRNNPERAERRRNVVLRKMYQGQSDYENELDSLIQIPLVLNYNYAREVQDVSKYFMRYLLKEFDGISDSLIKEDGSRYDVYNDGLKIYTSLDLELQNDAVKIQKKHFINLQSQFEKAWSGGNMFGRNNSIVDEQILKDKRYQKLRNDAKTMAEAIELYNEEKVYELWSWEGIESKTTTRIDSIKHYLRLLHASVYAVHPHTEEILIYLAGNDYSQFQYDNILAKRQVGSLFKPIVYLAALESGMQACDFIPNVLRSYEAYDDWTPKNANGEYGGYMAVHEALAHSVNAVSVQLLFKAGMENAVDLARRLGITSDIDPVPSLVLGTSDVSLMEIVNAYASILDGEQQVQGRAINRIEDHLGNVLYQRDTVQRGPKLGLDHNSLEALLGMMYRVSTEGTARSLYRVYDIPAVVFSKTGTTQNQTDGWYVAATNEIVIGSWVGHLNRRMHFPGLSSGSAARTALPLVGGILQSVYDRVEHKTPIMPQFFDCPEVLDSSLYKFYLEESRKDSIMKAEVEYGGWLKRLFGKKRKRLRFRYEDHLFSRELDDLKINRREKNKELQDAIIDYYPEYYSRYQ